VIPIETLGQVVAHERRGDRTTQEATQLVSADQMDAFCVILGRLTGINLSNA
jgi:hypothetical protein